MYMSAYVEEVERYYKRNYIASIVDLSMFSFVRIGLSPYIILPFYLQHLTNSSLLIGLIPAVYILFFAAPQLFVAKYIQRIKQRKNILIISSVGQRLCILGLILLTVCQNRLPDHITIIIFFTLYGIYNIGRGCYSPTYVDFIGRAIPRNRGRMLGVGNFFGGIITLIGSALLTDLLEAFPYPQAITVTFILAFVGSMISLVAIFSWKDIPLPEGEMPAEVSKKNTAWQKTLIPSKNFSRYLGWRSVITGLEMMLSFYAIYGLEKFNLSDSYLGIFTAILTLSDTIMNPIWGWLGDKVGYYRIMVAASILGCVGAVIAGVSNNLILYLLVFVLNGMMISGQSIGNMNIVYEFAPRVHIPTYSAISQVVLSPLSGGASLLGGYLIGVYGNEMVSLFASFMGAVGVIGFLVFVRDPLFGGQQSSRE